MGGMIVGFLKVGALVGAGLTALLALQVPAQAQTAKESAHQKWVDCRKQARSENVPFSKRRKFVSDCMGPATESSERGTDDQRMACMGDAFRVCGSDIPNVERITACMKKNISQLSPDCRAQFK